jgi:hypothetical protein
MTKNEKAALQHLINEAKVCKSKGRSYDWGGGAVVCTAEGDGPEMLENPHYKLGWQRCAEYVQLIVEEIFLKPKRSKDLNAAIQKWIGKEKLKEMVTKG